MQKTEECIECHRIRERCKAVNTLPTGEVEFVCPKCFKELEYDKFLYAYRQGKDIEC